VSDGSGSLRVALLQDGRGAAPVHELAAALRGLGHEAAVLGARDSGAPAALDALLRRRGFSAPLARVPFALAALARGDHQVAHAFSPENAYAAWLWRRRGGGPVVLSLAEPIERERLADGRLRLRLLSTALEQSDAVIVHHDAARVAAWRWLALEPQVIAPGDGPALERLYRRLLAQT
jgi:hypothetical protein